MNQAARIHICMASAELRAGWGAFDVACRSDAAPLAALRNDILRAPVRRWHLQNSLSFGLRYHWDGTLWYLGLEAGTSPVTTPTRELYSALRPSGDASLRLCRGVLLRRTRRWAGSDAGAELLAASLMRYLLSRPPAPLDSWAGALPLWLQGHERRGPATLRRLRRLPPHSRTATAVRERFGRSDGLVYEAWAWPAMLRYSGIFDKSRHGNSSSIRGLFVARAKMLSL